MADIASIDKNFSTETVVSEGVFLSVDEAPFRIYGLAGKDENGYYRMPQTIADKVNDGVKYLVRNTAGGMIRFRSDAKTVAVKAVGPVGCGTMAHMPLSGSAGFDLYVDGRFSGAFIPPVPANDYVSEKAVNIDGAPVAAGFHEFVIHMPLYGAYREIFVKVNEGARILPTEGFRNEKPVVFYGSSITQGGCASRPGLAYTNMISRATNTYCRNLGFSGSAHGETVMADYIASLDMTYLVLDYDYNSPVRELLDRHKGFFDRIRASKPDLPILLASAIPQLGSGGMKYDHDLRRGVIRATFDAALAAGDKNVHFINGFDFFTDPLFDDCTVDGCHPNDIGMLFMAKGFRKGLRELEEHLGVADPLF